MDLLPPTCFVYSICKQQTKLSHIFNTGAYGKQRTSLTLATTMMMFASLSI